MFVARQTCKKSVHYVVDGLPAHKTKRVKDDVASTRCKRILHFLPGYAPDLNLDELVWNRMKRSGAAKIPRRKGEKMKNKTGAQLAAIKNMPKLVRSIFKAASFVYIIDC